MKWSNHTTTYVRGLFGWKCLRLLPEPRRWGRGRALAQMMAAHESVVPWEFQEELIEIEGNTAAGYPPSIPRLAQCLASVLQVSALVSSLVSQAAALILCSPSLACASAQMSPGNTVQIIRNPAEFIYS